MTGSVPWITCLYLQKQILKKCDWKWRKTSQTPVNLHIMKISRTRFLDPKCRWTSLCLNSCEDQKVQTWPRWEHLRPALLCLWHRWHFPPSGRKPVCQQYFLDIGEDRLYYRAVTQAVKQDNKILTCIPKFVKGSVSPDAPRIRRRCTKIHATLCLKAHIQNDI